MSAEPGYLALARCREGKFLLLLQHAFFYFLSMCNVHNKGDNKTLVVLFVCTQADFHRKIVSILFLSIQIAATAHYPVLRILIEAFS